MACGVEPMLVPRTNQLAGVEDVYNAVLVEGDMLGDVVFYGKGAGKLPTASAVVADAIDALKDGVKIHDSLFWQPAAPIDGYYTDSAKYSFYIRVSVPNTEALFALPGARPVLDTHAAIVPDMNAAELAAVLHKLDEAGSPVAITMKVMQ